MIDAHVHVWTLDAARYPWNPTLPHVPIPEVAAPVDQLLEEMTAAGVSHAVLVQPSVYGWDNSYLADALAAHPERFVGVCLVDPRDPGAPAQLRRWSTEAGCRGLRINLITEHDPDWLLDTPLDQLWNEAASLGASLSLQIRPDIAGVVAELARRRPDLTVIVDYLGPDAFHDGEGMLAVAELARQENIWFKLLALGMDSRLEWPFRDLWPLYEAALGAFGPQRMVYGTDYPHIYQRTTYAEGARWIEELPFVDPDALVALTEESPRRLWEVAP